MVRRMLIGGITSLMLIGLPSLGHAQVSVSIGINLPAPPQLVPLPATPVMYAPAVGANYFFYAVNTTYSPTTAGTSAAGTTVRGLSSRPSSFRGQS
jgi:hypothetical protein